MRARDRQRRACFAVDPVEKDEGKNTPRLVIADHDGLVVVPRVMRDHPVGLVTRKAEQGIPPVQWLPAAGSEQTIQFSLDCCLSGLQTSSGAEGIHDWIHARETLCTSVTCGVERIGEPTLHILLSDVEPLVDLMPELLAKTGDVVIADDLREGQHPHSSKGLPMRCELRVDGCHYPLTLPADTSTTSAGYFWAASLTSSSELNPPGPNMASTNGA